MKLERDTRTPWSCAVFLTQRGGSMFPKPQEACSDLGCFSVICECVYMEKQRGRMHKINQDCPEHGVTDGTDDPGCGNLEKGATEVGGSRWPAKSRGLGHSEESLSLGARETHSNRHSLSY